MFIKSMLVAALAAGAAAPAFAAPFEVKSSAFAEQREAAADGTTKISLVPAGRVTPGDKLTLQLAYRNTGTQPIADIVLSNPVPAGMAYVAPAAGSPAPEVSVDGARFGVLSALKVKSANGGLRPATNADVKIVRWRLQQPVAAGGEGKVAFQAVIK